MKVTRKEQLVLRLDSSFASRLLLFEVWKVCHLWKANFFE
jgi:hypothetical protein